MDKEFFIKYWEKTAKMLEERAKSDLKTAKELRENIKEMRRN